MCDLLSFAYERWSFAFDVNLMQDDEMLFLLSLLFSTLRYMRSKYYPLHRCAFGSPERMRASRWFGYSRATIAWGHGWHGDFPRAFMKSTLQTWRLQRKKRIKNGLVEPWEEVVLVMPRWFRR